MKSDRLESRIALLLCVVAAVGSSTSAQHPAPQSPSDTYHLELVRNAVREPELALGLSFTEKQINRLGDRLAIALLKLYPDDTVLDPRLVRSYLPLLEAAFIAPGIVTEPQDRTPAVTLFLLRRAAAAAADSGDRERIEQVIAFVQSRARQQ